MAQYAPPIKGVEYIFYTSLVSQANPLIFQANPTLAAGDVKIAKDDGAPVNLATLPAVDGDFTKRIKVTVSAAEMTADNVSIVFSDAAGDEWCDLTVDIQPTATMEAGAVDDAGATTTVFDSTITEATADHFIGAVIVFTSGALKGQRTAVVDYRLDGAKGEFTVVALTEAPADGVTFVLY